MTEISVKIFIAKLSPIINAGSEIMTLAAAQQQKENLVKP